jgi:hypothetical protein
LLLGGESYYLICGLVLDLDMHIRVFVWTGCLPIISASPHQKAFSLVPSLFSAFWRVWIMAITVTVSNAAVFAVDQDFDFFAAGAVSSDLCGIALGLMNGGNSVVTLNAHSPTFIMRNNMNILSHNFSFVKMYLHQAKPHI